MVSMANAGVFVHLDFTFAMARDNLLPQMFRKVNERFKTPSIAMLHNVNHGIRNHFLK